MGSATLTSSPPALTARLVIDTDVASFVFKWHPEFAPPPGFRVGYPVHDGDRDAPGRAGCELGPRKCDVLDLADFSVLHSDSVSCSTWAAVRNESVRRRRPRSPADAWIAAALILSAPLVTNNPKDYRHLEKLQFVSANTT
jgi:hypothetical protein